MKRLWALLAPLLAGCALTVENDVGGFGGNSDRNYTNGLRLQYSARIDQAPGWTEGWAVPIVEAIDFFAPRNPPPGYRPAFALAFGQTMYSPQDLSRVDLIRDDRPYGGWLYAGIARSDPLLDGDPERRHDRETVFGFDLGVTGRPSLAEDTQVWFHRLIDSQSPNGWDNQIGFEPGLIVKLVHRRRLLYVGSPSDGPGFDLIGRAGISAGNIQTHGALGFLVRAGWNLPRDFGSDLAEKMGALVDDGIANDGISLHIFAGADGRAIARDIFLDGNTWRSSHEVSKEVLAGDLKAGVALQWGRLRLAYTHYSRTREFKRQDTPHAFGSITLGWTRKL